METVDVPEPVKRRVIAFWRARKKRAHPDVSGDSRSTMNNTVWMPAARIFKLPIRVIKTIVRQRDDVLEQESQTW